MGGNTLMDREFIDKIYNTYYNPIKWEKKVQIDLIDSKIEKYVVMTTGGTFRGSWAKQQDALSYTRREIRNHPTRDYRFIILEAKQEVGAKSPEIEIEDIK